MALIFKLIVFTCLYTVCHHPWSHGQVGLVDFGSILALKIGLRKFGLIIVFVKSRTHCWKIQKFYPSSYVPGCYGFAHILKYFINTFLKFLISSTFCGLNSAILTYIVDCEILTDEVAAPSLSAVESCLVPCLFSFLYIFNLFMCFSIRGGWEVLGEIFYRLLVLFLISVMYFWIVYAATAY